MNIYILDINDCKNPKYCFIFYEIMRTPIWLKSTFLPHSLALNFLHERLHCKRFLRKSLVLFFWSLWCSFLSNTAVSWNFRIIFTHTSLKRIHWNESDKTWHCDMYWHANKLAGQFQTKNNKKRNWHHSDEIPLDIGLSLWARPIKSVFSWHKAKMPIFKNHAYFSVTSHERKSIQLYFIALT